MSKREADEIDGEQQPGLKISKTEDVGDVTTVAVGGVTHNPISAYPEDEDILAAHSSASVPPPLPGHHLDEDVGEPTALTHMTAADAAAEAVDAINEVLNDTDYHHQHHHHHHPTADDAAVGVDGETPALPPPIVDGYDAKMGVNKSQSQPHKDRTEFTAEQKLQILAELDSEQPPSIQALIQKWGVSKSSLHRWKQPQKRERLQEMVGGAQSKLKRDMNDKFGKLKAELRRFCKENATKPEAEQFEINSPFIQVKSREIRDDLMRRHNVEPFLEEKEVDALKHFQGSKSWACVTGNELGYLSANKGENAIVWSEKAKANTAAYLHQMRPPPSAKKTRSEFTAQEKLNILKEMEAKDPDKPNLTVKQICQKYNTSKSSLHRWQQAFKSGKLQEAVESGGMANAKRIFRDKLNPIKTALHEFVKENESLPYDKQVPIVYSILQHKALLKKEEMLAQHQAENNLTADEVEALNNFKASNSWLRETSRRMGWQLAFVDGQKGTPLTSDAYHQYDPEAYEQQVASAYDMQQQEQQLSTYDIAPQEQQHYDAQPGQHLAPAEVSNMTYALAQDVEPAPVEGQVGDTINV
jgi:transposase-like protein